VLRFASNSYPADAGFQETEWMVLTPKLTDRFSFGILYVLVGLLTLWAGFRLVNHALEIRFFKDYLLQWEVGLNAFSVQEGQWPVFTGSNHAHYMERLASNLAQMGVTLPHSNTRSAYRYRVEHFGHRAEEIFVLCLHDRLVLFGLSERTLHRLDIALDGRADLTQGRISGVPGKQGTTYIGQVRL
jgi:hypothetical protein